MPHRNVSDFLAARIWKITLEDHQVTECSAKKNIHSGLRYHDLGLTFASHDQVMLVQMIKHQRNIGLLRNQWARRWLRPQDRSVK